MQTAERLRSSAWLRRAFIAAAVLALLVIAFSVPWKLNFMRGYIGERVREATGREFVIDGDVWWHWGLPGRLVANRVRYANPPWAGRPEMLTVDVLDARIALHPLLRKQLQASEVRLSHADLWLEINDIGQRNWYLDRQQSDEGTAPQFGRVFLEAARVRFRQAPRQTDLQVELQSLPGAGQSRLDVRVTGLWNGLKLAAAGQGDGVLQLREVERPYVLNVDASVGDTRIRADGQVTNLASPTAADFKLQLEGKTMGEWYRIANLGLPDTPPYTTAGRVRLKEGIWHYEDFSSRVGRSDLAGTIAFERRPERPLIRGSLVSKHFDLEDLGPTVGTRPTPKTSTAPPKSETDKPKPAPVTKKPEGKLLPQQEFKAEKWDTFDADLRLDARSVRNLGTLPLDDLKMRVVLDDRRLSLDPAQLQIAGGQLTGSLKIDGRVEPMKARVDARGRGLKLDQLLPKIKMTRAGLGNLNARAVLNGTGDSFGEMLGTANGEMQLAMGKGEISNLLLEILDLDAAETLGFLIRGDKPVPVRCALADVAFKRGIMETRTFLFDTTDTIIYVGGKADFAKEELELKVTPVAKDMSLATLRVPFDVQGAFADPRIMPDRAKLLARGGGAVLLGLLHPVAALIPLIETGPGKDSDCEQLVARARGEGVPVQDKSGAPTRPGASKQDHREARKENSAAPSAAPAPARK